jgi:hypothetical protein
VVIVGLVGILMQKQKSGTNSTSDLNSTEIIYEKMSFQVASLVIFESELLPSMSQRDYAKNQALFDSVDIYFCFYYVFFCYSQAFLLFIQD